MPQESNVHEGPLPYIKVPLRHGSTQLWKGQLVYLLAVSPGSGLAQRGFV